MYPKGSNYRATRNISSVLVLLAFLLVACVDAADSDWQANEDFETFVKVAREQASILNAGHQVRYEMRQVIPEGSPWSGNSPRPLLRATQTFVRGEGERSDREEVWEVGADNTIGTLTTVAWNYNQSVTIRHAEQTATILKCDGLGFDVFSPLHYPMFGGVCWPDAFEEHVYENSRLVDGYLEITFADKYNSVRKYRYYVDTRDYTVVRQEDIVGEHIEKAAVYSDYRMVEGMLMYPYSQVLYQFGHQSLRKDGDAVTEFDPDMAYQRYEMQVNEAAITLNLSEDFFSPTPPHGYQVVDVLRNTSYIQGESPSADTVLDAQVEALLEYQGDNLLEEVAEMQSDTGLAAASAKPPLVESPGVGTDVGSTQPEEGSDTPVAVLIVLAVVVVLVLIAVGMTRKGKRK